MKILKKVDEILAIAQRQGTIKDFTFYTLDNEYANHYPHVHICIKKDGKTLGEPLKNGSDFLSLGSIRLRPDEKYTLETLEFETVINPDILTSKNKKIFIQWLLEENKRFKAKNCFKCVSDYDDSNPKYKDRIKYQVYLGELQK